MTAWEVRCTSLRYSILEPLDIIGQEQFLSQFNYCRNRELLVKYNQRIGNDRLHLQTRTGILPDFSLFTNWLTATMPPKLKYVEGEKVLCFHGPLLYEAKVSSVSLVVVVSSTVLKFWAAR